VCIKTTFDVLNALELSILGQRYDMIVDSELFNIFSDEKRSTYIERLHAVLRPEGRYHILRFSEHEPGSERPCRISKEGIRTIFDDEWNVDVIRDATFDSTLDSRSAQAYLAPVTQS
jgi:cyclopropane fatty-acyl-phospholipid synthase-like methyltransferase